MIINIINVSYRMTMASGKSANIYIRCSIFCDNGDAWNDRAAKRNGKGGGRAGDGLEKQLPTINKKNWFDGRETPTYYHQDVYISLYAFDGERINISRTASPLTPDPVAKRPPLRDHWSYITHIPLYAGIKAEESNAKYYPFSRPYPIKWKSSIWIFMNIAV